MEQTDCARRDFIGIGVGAPGPLDRGRGIVLVAPNLGWKDFPLAQRIQARLNLPTTLDNDANCATFGEWWQGAARGGRNVVGITIGTGIGGGLIINGALYHGSSDMAGEIGHTTIELNGRHCKCGNYCCLEAYSPAPALATRAREVRVRGAGDPGVGPVPGLPPPLRVPPVPRPAPPDAPAASVSDARTRLPLTRQPCRRWASRPQVGTMELRISRHCATSVSIWAASGSMPSKRRGGRSRRVERRDQRGLATSANTPTLGKTKQCRVVRFWRRLDAGVIIGSKHTGKCVAQSRQLQQRLDVATPRAGDDRQSYVSRGIAHKVHGAWGEWESVLGGRSESTIGTHCG